MVSDALEDAAGINKKSSKMFKKLDRLCLLEKNTVTVHKR